MPTRSTLLIIVHSLALMPTAWAASPATSDSSLLQTVSGTVVSSTSDSLVIKTGAGDEEAFVTDVNVALPSGIAPGRRVTVTYRDPAGARQYAVGVTMADSASPPRPLPATASRVPLLILVGLTVLAGALTIRAALRWSA